MNENNIVWRKCKICGGEYVDNEKNFDESGVCCFCNEKKEKEMNKKLKIEKYRDEIYEKIDKIRDVLYMTENMRHIAEDGGFLYRLVKTYGDVIDIEKEILKADLWLVVNKRRKKDYRRFLMNWMNKSMRWVEYKKILKERGVE